MGGKPVARSAHAMAADEHSLFLFGGMSTDDNGEPVPLDDTYMVSLAGNRPQWKLIQASGDVPVKREGHTLSFVAPASLLYVFGGSNDDDGTEFNDVISFDASRSQWKKRA